MEYFVIAVGTVTCAIIVLTVFFSVWSALMRKMKGVHTIRRLSYFDELPDRVDIHLKDGRTFESAKFESVLEGEKEFPWGMVGLVCIQCDKKRFFIKPDSIRVIEERFEVDQYNK